MDDDKRNLNFQYPPSRIVDRSSSDFIVWVTDQSAFSIPHLEGSSSQMTDYAKT
jgi:hypothetical protein